jgi:hypothetical protein
MDFEGKEGLLFRNQATKTGLIFPSLDGLRLWSLGNIMQTLAFIMLLPIMGYW